MNFIAKWWKNRHRHDWQEIKISCGEAWGAPAFFIRHKCKTCPETHYYLSTIHGKETVDQTWASHYFPGGRT